MSAPLWFALGANGEHGLPLSKADKKHAVELALREFYFWRDVALKSGKDIARQVGCDQTYVLKIIEQRQDMTSHILPDRVTGKDGKSYPATRGKQERPVSVERDATAPEQAGAEDSLGNLRTPCRAKGRNTWIRVGRSRGWMVACD